MDVGTKAKELYLSGFSCGEAVAKAMKDAGLAGVSADAIKACSAFKTGIGGCKGDLCGCLLAALVTVGIQYGRDNNQDDIAEVNAKSAELYDRFQKKYRTLLCRELTKGFPMDNKEVFLSQERKELCAEIVRFVAGELAEIV